MTIQKAQPAGLQQQPKKTKQRQAYGLLHLPTALFVMETHDYTKAYFLLCKSKQKALVALAMKCKRPHSYYVELENRERVEFRESARGEKRLDSFYIQFEPVKLYTLFEFPEPADKYLHVYFKGKIPKDLLLMSNSLAHRIELIKYFDQFPERVIYHEDNL